MSADVGRCVSDVIFELGVGCVLRRPEFPPLSHCRLLRVSLDHGSMLSECGPLNERVVTRL